MIYQLGDWMVDEAANRLVRDGEEVRVENRVMAVLSHLAAAKGEVVSKDALIDLVWNGAVVSDHSVANAISDLRRVLGDDRRNPQYIETIPKSGYRLITSPTYAATEGSKQDQSDNAPGQRKFITAFAAGFAIIAAAVFWFVTQPHEPKRLYLTNIENATGEPSWSLAGEAGAEMLAVVLAGGDFRLVRWRAAQLGASAPSSTHVINNHDRLLSGRMFLDGQTLMLSLQLIDPSDGAAVWAGAYEFGAEHYGSLAEKIVADLKGPLGLRTPRLVTGVEPAIIEAYWRARYLWSLREHDAIREALYILTDITISAPNFAPAHAAIADIYAQKTAEELAEDRAETFPIAEQHLARAFALDSTLGDAFVTKAFIHFYRDHDNIAAMTAVQTAIGDNQDNALAWQTRAMIESAEGRAAESIKSIARARALDPLSASMLWDEVWFLYVAERYDDAMQAAIEARRVSAPVEVYEALIHAARGDEGAAFASWISRARARGFVGAKVESIQLIAKNRNVTEAIAALAEAALDDTTGFYEHPVPLAALLLAAKEDELAIKVLTEAPVAEKSWWWRWYGVIPAFDNIRNDPRLSKLPLQQADTG